MWISHQITIVTQEEREELCALKNFNIITATLISCFHTGTMLLLLMAQG
jgi:hypothetical protein